MSYKNLLKRIDQRLTALGLSERKACLLAGLKVDSIRNIRRGAAPKIETLLVLERALKTRPRYLIDAVEVPDFSSPDDAADSYLAHVKEVPIKGALQAGHWLEVVHWPEEEWEVISLPTDPNFWEAQREAYRVADHSMSRVYPAGTIVICIACEELDQFNWRHANFFAGSGERVIVHRTSADGLIEATVREHVAKGDKHELWLRSDKPPSPIDLPGPPGSPSESRDVRIVGLVVGSYRPEPIFV
jgi:transcriptional regulator with XRE-family HTH domain